MALRQLASRKHHAIDTGQNSDMMEASSHACNIALLLSFRGTSQTHAFGQPKGFYRPGRQLHSPGRASGSFGLPSRYLAGQYLGACYVAFRSFGLIRKTAGIPHSMNLCGVFIIAMGWRRQRDKALSQARRQAWVKPRSKPSGEAGGSQHFAAQKWQSRHRHSGTVQNNRPPAPCRRKLELTHK